MGLLESQMARLLAKEACRSLAHDYARACDLNDAAAVAGMFLDDAILVAGDHTFRGRPAIEKFYVDALGATTCHIVGAMALDATADDVVEAQATFMAVEVAGEARLLWGTYVDRIVVQDDRARFAARRITIEGSAAL
jgi:hypothetical protein